MKKLIFLFVLFILVIPIAYALDCNTECRNNKYATGVCRSTCESYEHEIGDNSCASGKTCCCMTFRGIRLSLKSHTSTDYERIKSWGLNTVMFGYMWSYIEDDPMVPGNPDTGEGYRQDRLQILEDEIEQARSYGLYTIIAPRICYNPNNSEMKSYHYPWKVDGVYVGPTHDYVSLNLDYCSNPETGEHYIDGLAPGRDRYANHLNYIAQRFPDTGIAVWHFPYHQQSVDTEQIPDVNRRDIYYQETLPAMYQAIRSVDENRLIVLVPIHQGARSVNGVKTITGEYAYFDQYIDYFPIDDKKTFWECNTHDGAYARECRGCVSGKDDEWDYDYEQLDEQWQPAADFKTNYDVNLISIESIGLVIHPCTNDACPQCGIRPIDQSRLDWTEAMLQKQDELDMSWIYWRYEKSPITETPQEEDGSNTSIADLLTEYSSIWNDCNFGCQNLGYVSGVCKSECGVGEESKNIGCLPTQTCCCLRQPAGCSGSVELTLYPSYVYVGSTVTASVSGLNNCDGKYWWITPVGTCYPVQLPEDSCVFTAPSQSGTYEYNVFIDIDGSDSIGDYPGESDSTHLTVSSGPRGCPTLFVYDGNSYVKERKSGIHSEEGIDTVDEILLKNKPVMEDGIYTLSLKETTLPEHSHIDSVRLLVDGEEVELLSAMHSKYGDVTAILKKSDNIRTDTEVLDSIELKFLASDVEAKSFIFRIEGYNPPPRYIKVDVLNALSSIVMIGIGLLIIVVIFAVMKYIPK